MRKHSIEELLRQKILEVNEKHPIFSIGFLQDRFVGTIPFHKFQCLGKKFGGIENIFFFTLYKNI